jgi:competence protein ComEC
MGEGLGESWRAHLDIGGWSAAKIARFRDRVGRRPYHVAAAALAVGLALAGAPKPAAVITAGMGAAALAAVRLQRLALLVAAMVIIGALAGGWRLNAIDASAARAGPAGRTVVAQATLLEHPRPSLFGSSAALQIDSGSAAGARVLARLDGRRGWPGGGQPGTVLRVAGTVKEPASGSSFDWRAYLRRRGIAFELALDSLEPTGRRRGGLLGAVDSMRRRAETALGSRLPEEKAAVARGMVLGQDEAIDPLERDDFRRAGLAHVLAVSGQNVMLLCALALPLLGLIGAGPRARIAVLLGLIAVYVLLAGAGASLQRAGVMGAAGLIALAAGRPASRWYMLELAAAATLALNPRVAGDTGWQLSFAAVVGILLLARPIQAGLRAAPRLVAEGAAVTLAATLATAPLIAHAFGSISLAGVVANVVALPLVAGIMWSGMVQCALAQAPGILGITAALIDAIGALDGVLLGLLRRLVRAFADAPGASVALPLGSPAGVVIAYGLIGLTAVMIRRGAARIEPRTTTAAAAWRRLPARSRTAAVALLGAMVACGWSWATTPPAPPGRLTVSFLDVGQGDATLVQDGAGTAVLFDGGPPEARVYRRLRAAGVNRLDLVVATHQSRDHQGGLHEVIARIPTRLMLENGCGTRDGDFRRLIAEANAHGIRHVPARAGQVLHVGRLTIEILGPPRRAPGTPPPDDPNPIGVAAIVSEGDYDLWLSADAESDAILRYPLRPVEAMKVSHHGSADPGLPEVLKRLNPQVAAIEVGTGNSYGHPTPETMKALEAAVPHVYRTDEDGTITLTVADNGSQAVSSAR